VSHLRHGSTTQRCRGRKMKGPPTALRALMVLHSETGLCVKWVSGVSLHGSNPEPRMSALGQKKTLGKVRLMSALPPKAGIDRACRDVRFVPKADELLLLVTRPLANHSAPLAGTSCAAWFHFRRSCLYCYPIRIRSRAAAYSREFGSTVTIIPCSWR